MEAITKQDIEFLKREERRIQNLLKGKVKMIISAMLMLWEYS